jgi:hypothetical protein
MFTYAVAERQLVQVSQVTYVGREKTRLSMIQNTAQIRPKTPMKRGDLLEAESAFLLLNIFDWSKVGPQRPITDQMTKPLSSGFTNRVVTRSHTDSI